MLAMAVIRRRRYVGFPFLAKAGMADLVKTSAFYANWSGHPVGDLVLNSKDRKTSGIACRKAKEGRFCGWQVIPPSITKHGTYNFPTLTQLGWSKTLTGSRQ